MARSLASTIISEVTSTNLRPILMVQQKFDSGDINLWTGYRDLVVDSETFVGAGDLGNISPIKESQRTKAEGLQFNLSGINSSLLSLALQEDYQDRIINLWLGFMDDNNVFIARVLMFKGRMDVMTITESGITSTISITAENILIALERPNERRYTDEDQKLTTPADEGFSQVVSLQQKDVVWGKS